VSNQSGTVADTLYVMPSNGAALNTSVTKTLITANTTTNPPYLLPALSSLWGGASYAIGRALRVVVRGTIGTAATAPTLILSYQADLTQNSQTSAVTLAATGAATITGSLASAAFELEFGIDVNSVGTTASSIDVVGKFTYGAGNNAATTAATAIMVGSAASITTMVPTSPYFMELWATWGTSSASNTIQVLQHEIIALN
jgi:hypothetical protein